jgi:uncharacterized Zn-finger protein
MTFEDPGHGTPPPGVEIEVTYVDSKTAVCDGGVGVLGHPRVFLAIDETDKIECPYCSRIFVYAPDKAEVSELPGRMRGPKPR